MSDDRVARVRSKVVELAPHYLAMVLLLIGVVAVIRTQFGRDLGFVTELLIMLVAVFLYRWAVLYFGVAPASWER